VASATAGASGASTLKSGLEVISESCIKHD
jgi:hypothetical protein